jgi:flagellin-like hook-associated protein FlgL
MPSAITMSGAASANIQILQLANEQFQISQKRVSTGKWVFGAADDTTRYKMSETMLSRSRQIGDVNNNIGLALKTLEATDKSLKSMISLVESAQNLARKAQSEGAESIRGVSSPLTVTGTGQVVSAALVNGSRFSVTSDGGGTFTYTFGAAAATTTWGEVLNALNAANIGVIGELVPATTAGQYNVRFRATNGQDFRFNGTTDENFMTALGAITSPTGGALNVVNQFTVGATAPAAAETGFNISYGGTVNTVVNVTAATAVAANSILVFKDGDGNARTLTYTAASTVGVVLADINAMNAGVRAELVNSGAGTTTLRLRNTKGGNMEILAGAGAFVGAAGLVRFGATANIAQTSTGVSLSADPVLRLRYGQQFDNIIANINAMVTNNPVQTGRNLLIAQSLAVVMDEFGGTPITVTGANLAGTGTTNNSLGFTAAVSGGSWTNDTTIQNAATASNQALVILRDLQGSFATFNSFMKERYDINKSYSMDLKTQGDELVAADMAEESANMTALQTRQSFAVQSFSMGSQNEQSLLRLLG